MLHRNVATSPKVRPKQAIDEVARVNWTVFALGISQDE
jgi:hypothetical protein